MSGDHLRAARTSRGLSQVELAELAGVSRQLVGSVESGRHLPRVDAALRLARALGLDVRELFGDATSPEHVLEGREPAEGALIRTGQVGDKMVFAPARVEAAGWDSADAVVEGGRIRRLATPAGGPVMVGCEPGLEVIERNLRESGRGALAVEASSRAAAATLAGGRSHVAVIHGPPKRMPESPPGVNRFHLCGWQVGLAGGPETLSGWFEDVIAADGPVVQRESGAAVQETFEKAAGPGRPGPVAGGHIEAVRLGLATGLAAVTIEPAAGAIGASFHALETHDVELWVAEELLGDPAVEAVMNEITGLRFQKRLAGVGGYDLSRIGSRAA